MLGWTDLKLWIAVCWYTVWNVDPLPLSVPLSWALAAVAVPVPVAVGCPRRDDPLSTSKVHIGTP
jgi:hypothetical protein